VPCDSNLVVATARKTFKKQRKALPYTADYLKRLWVAANTNGSGKCFAAVDQDGQTHAALFVAWDLKRAYYVAGGTDPELRASGADSLLLWHILQFCAERTEAFDFAGSVVEGIEKFFRSFGGKLVPCNRILKLPAPLRAYRAVMKRQ
jgi:lipid II:glycine glycyltransferase (peptidoglycan interpeptide bridge formation enzyme)